MLFVALSVLQGKDITIAAEEIPSNQSTYYDVSLQPHTSLFSLVLLT